MISKDSGNCNTGHGNTGDCNTGDCNTGDCNTGDWNTGYRNTGVCNTGDWNTGDCNTGDCNTGDWNTGYRNTGGRNAGDWNTGDWNAGYFNTKTPTDVMVFNSRCPRTVWESIDKPDFICFKLSDWIMSDDMTKEEKEKNPGHETSGGYLKSYEYKEAFRRAWDKAALEDRKKVLNLPNFDNEIFKEISGIDVEKELNTSPPAKVVTDGYIYKLAGKA